MSLAELKEGDYEATATSAKLVQSPKTGTHAIEVSFQVHTAERSYTMNWQGWLSPKATENTMRTLVEVLGFNGDDELKPGCINTKDRVSVVVGVEKGEDGKEYRRIKFVNKLGGKSAFAEVKVDQVKATLGSLGFKAAFLEAKKSVPTTNTNEPLPF